MRAERKEAEYLAYQRLNNLFFDERTDDQLIQFRQKLRTKRRTVTCWQKRYGLLSPPIEHRLLANQRGTIGNDCSS